jgi:hypothetical protein
MNQHVVEVEQALSSFPKRTSSQNPEAYIGGGQSSLRYRGISDSNRETEANLRIDA